MQDPNKPAFAAVGAMADTLEFVKKLWGGMGVPGMVLPTVSPDEINKKIADLKAVETWLTMNMNMLRSTIQTLEVQSGTIAALQSMGAAMSAVSQPSAAAPFESPFAPRSSSSASVSAADAASGAARGTGRDAGRDTGPDTAPAATPGLKAGPLPRLP